LDRLIRRVGDGGQKKLHPRLPDTFSAKSIQQVVVHTTMLFEIQAEVEQWLAQGPSSTEQEGDQEPSQASVAIEERVNRFELNVSKAGLQ
jgi:hypothetical protein